MDSASVYLTVLGVIFVPFGLFVAIMARRQRLQEEADDAERASGTPAE